ncbi:aspartate kinase [Egicoccus halophilus]|uniref:Aspartokinase n=1 Tax=Egicoccus halophilus TaxID=1670830 RepID=A0A8J3ET08_9ACTN|nr:aspartate kinase [Egicoccus halophilus]GGI02766.1 aspartokinase [Egicoccus halophilus]
MAIVVQKYGGTSVGDVDRMKRVADRVARSHRGGNQTVVVVSAMGKTTDELVDMAARISEQPPERELDILLTAGERISMSLLAIALAERGVPAKSFTGSQAGIITDAVHGKARIVDITPGRVQGALEEGNVVIVAGFQGVSQDTKDITTLGRGGSDTTAVALAAALGADVCEIYTDVDGVFTADPRIVHDARKLDYVSYEEMLEMSAQGAGVLQVRSVEFGRNHDVRIHVRSSFSYTAGTWVGPEEDKVEDAIISGVAHDTSEAKMTVHGVPDTPGVASRLFSALAQTNVNIDMIVQNVSSDGRTDISFTLPRGDQPQALSVLEPLANEIHAEGINVDDNIAKVSLVGAGMKTHPGVAAKMFGALSTAGVNIEMISTSTIRVSVVVSKDQVEQAVLAVHDAFDLADEQVAQESN